MPVCIAGLGLVAGCHKAHIRLTLFWTGEPDSQQLATINEEDSRAMLMFGVWGPL